MRFAVRSTFVSLALALAGGVAVAQTPRPANSAGNAAAPDTAWRVAEFDAAVHAIVSDKSFKDAEVGIAIMDVESGHLLAAANEHGALNPASNAKLYTAAAALAILHGDHVYETTLGGERNGISVAGPLTLRGFGDPTLETRDLWAMVQELRTQGIRRIEGDIVVDQRFYDDMTTPPAFEQKPAEWAAFRAPVSAVAVNENTVTMLVRPGEVGQGANVSFDPPGFVDVEGTVTTSESGADNVVLALRPNGKRLAAKVAGSVATDSRVVRYTRRVDDPNLLAGYVLKHLLEQAQIRVGGDVKAGAGKGGVLVRHKSRPLAQILPELGKASDNFVAEMVFKSLGGEKVGRPAKSASGALAVTKWLDTIGANDEGVVIKNGSGLYDANRVTASSVVRLLRAAYRDPAVQPEFLEQLAIGGVDGTLRRRFASERGRRAVRAKTGTLDDAIALSGYVMGPPGKGAVAFSVLFNKVEGKAAGARSVADKLVELVARKVWER
ncbi:MAG: D-alanyl-D-alanine carboxypeptidase/D-alanyl-D-alanine-endopeptidase [Polyangiaceae bacterium]